MSSDLNDLADWMEKTGDQFEIRASEMVGQMALQAGTMVAIGTPVDTGRARANWFAGAADDPSALTEQTDPSAMLSISRIKEAAENVGKGESVFLYNNLPYVAGLNDGNSKQAPAGFVENAIKSAEKAIRDGGLI